MGDRINKYGLRDSHLKEAQRRKIRRDAGYGCVICGALFIQYEHIEPEFHEAREHDPDKMTLLCGTHHDDVSYKRRTKKSIWEAKANPKNKPGGIISRSLYHQKIDTNIIVGSNSLGAVGHKIFDSILTISGKPLLWFESDFEVDSPVEICAIFHGEDGKPHAYINRNCFITSIANYDIKGKGAKITISQNGEVILVLNFEGDKTLKVERLKMSYKDTKALVRTNNILHMEVGCSTYEFDSSRIARISLGKVAETRRTDEGEHSAIALAIRVAISGIKVLSYNGFTLGWIVGSLILNKEYCFVANVGDARGFIYDVTGEYIGFISWMRTGGEKVAKIAMKGNAYDSGEPIWIIPSERMIENVKKDNDYDLGYRLFESKEAYQWI
ncbi:TPA: hypothetical protein N3414_004307 [Klebsiella quasipneumoniae subsp. quasipneumoniae]|uniref:hypothetical protein n=1 Tax=Klebsiella quasipneumoniae TaxID=1463165 RepID=UPI00388EE5DB|nr:hypothetical protein [Klebsiella quasipneumoniae subsp. quasipneumoniae]HCM7677039.1 hypothetical protein [Klebsiella quasipneumoniae subsp. quasipneumoniae]